jgi:polyphosphate kinase 2
MPKGAKPQAENGGKMKRKEYEKELRKLQVELCHLQDWVKAEGSRVIVVFEGRDAAGKGGTIKAITERVSPRVFRVVALPAPSDREKSQMFLQRYIEHFPAGGEIVIFDRSWYNRAGVENVMGFIRPSEVERFLELCPEVERYITEAGIVLIKFWLEVGKEEQERRFLARINDPMRQWKLSPMDLESFRRCVRLFPRARRDVQGDRYGQCAVAYRQIRRQKTRAKSTQNGETMWVWLGERFSNLAGDHLLNLVPQLPSPCHVLAATTTSARGASATAAVRYLLRPLGHD